jgi:hypothetical protein
MNEDILIFVEPALQTVNAKTAAGWDVTPTMMVDIGY